jgi:hypothetical protein
MTMELWCSCHWVQEIYLSKNLHIISVADDIDNSDTSVCTVHVTLQLVWFYSLEMFLFSSTTRPPLAPTVASVQCIIVALHPTVTVTRACS